MEIKLLLPTTMPSLLVVLGKPIYMFDIEKCRFFCKVYRVSHKIFFRDPLSFSRVYKAISTWRLHFSRLLYYACICHLNRAKGCKTALVETMVWHRRIQNWAPLSILLLRMAGNAVKMKCTKLACLSSSYFLSHLCTEYDMMISSQSLKINGKNTEALLALPANFVSTTLQSTAKPNVWANIWFARGKLNLTKYINLTST